MTKPLTQEEINQLMAAVNSDGTRNYIEGPLTPEEIDAFLTEDNSSCLTKTRRVNRKRMVKNIKPKDYKTKDNSNYLSNAEIEQLLTPIS